MADSDNSTTLPSVTPGRGQRPTVHGVDRFDDADPALALLQGWLRAEHVSHILCRLQQRLERIVLNAADPDAVAMKVGYSIACQAEVEATTAALKLQDKLPCVQARSLLGIVAKLEIITGADRDIDDPIDFPGPHIASVLEDLKKIAGRPPSERPGRSSFTRTVSTIKRWRPTSSVSERWARTCVTVESDDIVTRASARFTARDHGGAEQIAP